MKSAASLQCKSFKIKIGVMPALTKKWYKDKLYKGTEKGAGGMGARDGKEGSMAKLIIFPVPKEDIYTWE